LQTANRAPLVVPSPTPRSLPLFLIRTKKTKASKKSAATQFQEDDDYEAGPGKGHGGKKGKGRLLTEEDLTDMQLPGEKFELKVLEERMKDGIEKLRVNLKTVVGRVGRVSPGEPQKPFVPSHLRAHERWVPCVALLDNVRVDSPEGKRPLNEFATVSVKDGKDLLVTCYEESVRLSFSLCSFWRARNRS
jgi:ribosome recycling factor